MSQRRWFFALAFLLLLALLVPRWIWRERLLSSGDALTFRDVIPGKPSPNPTRLVVLVHGWVKGREAMQQVRDVVAQSMPDADILWPGFGSTLFSNEDPFQVTR